MGFALGCRARVGAIRALPSDNRGHDGGFRAFVVDFRGIAVGRMGMVCSCGMVPVVRVGR